MNPAVAADFGVFRGLVAEAAGAPPRGPDRNKPLWIFGAGGFGKDACAALRAAGFRVKGFIETRPSAPEVLGLPVKTWGDFAAGPVTDQLVFGVFNHRTPFNTLESAARSAGFNDIVMPWGLYAALGGSLGWRYWLGGPRAILENLDSIERVWACLADDASRLCLLRILAFRLGRDDDYAGFRHAEPPYFNELTLGGLPEALSYVDGGAYDGGTFLDLLRSHKVASAYLFEPDPANFRDLVAAVAGLSVDAVCLPLGLMDGYRVLSFNAEGGAGSAMSDQGSTHVAAAALDQILARGRVDFIKMDIEGSERRAIQGAERIIRAFRPVLAVSVYHRPDDLWGIPLDLLPMCPNYKFHLRQHCFNSFDSVLYAVPQRIDSI